MQQLQTRRSRRTGEVQALQYGQWVTVQPGQLSGVAPLETHSEDPQFEPTEVDRWAIASLFPRPAMPALPLGAERFRRDPSPAPADGFPGEAAPAATAAPRGYRTDVDPAKHARLQAMFDAGADFDALSRTSRELGIPVVERDLRRAINWRTQNGGRTRDALGRGVRFVPDDASPITKPTDPSKTVEELNREKLERAFGRQSWTNPTPFADKPIPEKLASIASGFGELIGHDYPGRLARDARVAAEWLPFVGGASAIEQGGMDFERGDYLSGAVNTGLGGLDFFPVVRPATKLLRKSISGAPEFVTRGRVRAEARTFSTDALERRFDARGKPAVHPARTDEKARDYGRWSGMSLTQQDETPSFRTGLPEMDAPGDQTSRRDPLSPDGGSTGAGQFPDIVPRTPAGNFADADAGRLTPEAPPERGAETAQEGLRRGSATRQHQPVITLSGTEFAPLGSSHANLTSQAIRWFIANLRGTTAVTRDGQRVRFTRRGGTKTISRKGERLIRAVPAIRRIIEEGDVVAAGPSDRPGIEAIQWISAPITVGDWSGSVAVMVRKHQEGWLQYDITDAVFPGTRPEAGGAASKTLGSPAVESDPGDLNLFLIGKDFNTKASAASSLTTPDTSKLETARDIRRALQEVERASESDDGRRLEITRAAIGRLAADLGLEPMDLWRGRSGRGLNSEQAVQATRILASSADELIALAGEVRGGSIEKLAEFQRAFLRNAAIQEQIGGSSLGAGPMLARFKMLDRAKTERTRLLQRMVDAGGRERLEELANAILERQSNPAELNRLIRVAMKPGQKGR